MIEFIQEKLGKNLTYIEQEKFDDEYVESYVFDYKFKGEVHTVEVYFDGVWRCNLGYVFFDTKLSRLLDRMILEFS